MKPIVKEFLEKLAQCKTCSLWKFDEKHVQNDAYSKAIRRKTYRS